MDDTVLKVAFVSGAFVALYLVARRLSATPSADEQKAAAQKPPPLDEREPVPEGGNVPAVGFEVPFPFDVRELEAKYGPDWKRPSILNYYFRKIDLVAGPPDPLSFYDELILELEDRGTGYRWTTSFFVTTPKGLEQVMLEDNTQFVFGASTIIVRRFDLKTILQAALEVYADTQMLESEAARAHESSREPESLP